MSSQPPCELLNKAALYAVETNRVKNPQEIECPVQHVCTGLICLLLNSKARRKALNKHAEETEPPSQINRFYDRLQKHFEIRK